ncbi:hypothetical protein BC936DRAFT_149005 [Jimgerdemannia flammicorona]|uniref:Uncharacterized protein n=1 Tax=Jimgerdemannia flammicorona TaxID=994334 RepID=A0A433D1S2_9FUNG|nr:hypothetical protein BC936DRAFT_149005 [Jimgerdemannia flammicorona]
MIYDMDDEARIFVNEKLRSTDRSISLSKTWSNDGEQYSTEQVERDDEHVGVWELNKGGWV